MTVVLASLYEGACRVRVNWHSRETLLGECRRRGLVFDEDFERGITPIGRMCRTIALFAMVLTISFALAALVDPPLIQHVSGTFTERLHKLWHPSHHAPRPPTPKPQLRNTTGRRAV